ncbi:uncharacterized protein LOC125738203 isoform X7 [Brienomyrus brachyistius]|uniref:uncharacterized protein LOC125738203 isoform X7 n=1 Tax=Brienomyrus brachyistius TaxID=42636 RepID=UPI0020B3C31E|nr:uncharacterized protein LOC125738203 isoform X7 [Brienomyrus brachyistius]
MALISPENERISLSLWTWKPAREGAESPCTVPRPGPRSSPCLTGCSTSSVPLAGTGVTLWTLCQKNRPSGQLKGVVKCQGPQEASPLNAALFCPRVRHASTDCCVHCVLACLFCQFDRVCGSCLFFFCCCCRCWRYCEPDSSDPEDGSDCTCESCCGLVGSTECLEFSKDCCGICFPT